MKKFGLDKSNKKLHTVYRRFKILGKFTSQSYFLGVGQIFDQVFGQVFDQFFGQVLWIGKYSVQCYRADRTKKQTKDNKHTENNTS